MGTIPSLFQDVRIQIHDLKASISDKRLCDNLLACFKMSGIGTRDPHNIRRIDGTLVVDLSVSGTFAPEVIQGATRRLLDTKPNVDEVYYTSCEVNAL